jgi:sugar-phosphatase
MITVATDDGRTRTIRGVLFDMDGTVVDSIAVTERTWNAWADANDVGEGFRILHGQPAIDTVRHSFPAADESTIARLAREQTATEHADVVGIEPMPGALALLAWLDTAGVPWAIVTSADTMLATVRLEAAGILAPAVVSCEHVTRGKPDPQPYAIGARLIGVPIAECLVVEDALAGVDAGLASGAVTAALNDLPGDIRIHDLVDLHSILASGLSS